MTEKQTIWLSVILPTYQGERHLDAALASVAEQVGHDVEMIVLDDGSTDQTVQIIEKWQEKLNLQVVRLIHTGNWVKNTNYGFRMARGKWITILHQDDIWQPGRLKALHELTVRFREVNFFLHPVLFINEEGHKIGRWRSPLPVQQPVPPASVLPRLIVQNFISIISPMFSRSLLEETGLMDEQSWYFADWDLWLRMAERESFVYVNEELASFRVHPSSQTSTRTSDLEEIARQYDKIVSRVLESSAFPDEEKERANRMNGFSREMYLYMLAVIHKEKRPVRKLLREAFRAGPLGVARYIRYSRLFDRLLPRIRMMGKQR